MAIPSTSIFASTTKRSSTSPMMRISTCNTLASVHQEPSRSISTRIAEVDDPGAPDEHEEPVGHDRGFFWRLYTYDRYEQKDGGTYMEIEFVFLSRSIPAIFVWIVKPYLRKIPTGYLTEVLDSTRRWLHIGTHSEPPGGSRSRAPGADPDGRTRKLTSSRQWINDLQVPTQDPCWTVGEFADVRASLLHTFQQVSTSSQISTLAHIIENNGRGEWI